MVQEQNEFEQLDPNLIRAEHLSSAIFLAIVLFVGLIAWVFFALFGWGLRSISTWGALAAGIVLLAGASWWSYQYPYLRWKTTKLRNSPRGLELHRGVYWQHKIFIPRERIQHTDITQGPISRKFQIAELVINTAGNHNYVIKIEGLSVERARVLRLELLPRTQPATGPKIGSTLQSDSISLQPLLESESISHAPELTEKIDIQAEMAIETPSGSEIDTVATHSNSSTLDRKEDEIERAES